LILGAWGCGAFRNDPEVVAPILWEQLSGAFRGRIPRVVMSVLDTSKQQHIFAAFAKRFRPESSGIKREHP
jgi:uncharacterized protein (TIGR02452 family)